MRRSFFPFLVLLFAATLAACGSADHNVLFIGNSYTHFNDMPGMVEEIAGANGVKVKTKMIAPGGAFLREHVANPDVIDEITSGNYDTVVFQEQSVAPSVLAYAEQNTIPAAIQLSQIASNSGARVVWFQTWGHLNGFPSEGHASYESMQAAIVTTYDELSRQTGAPVARVGERWQQARTSLAAGLYNVDGTHPSPAGSYLAALQITETITRVEIVDAPAVDGVDEATATSLLNS